MARNITDTVGKKNLSDQLKAFKAAMQITELHRKLDEYAFYPPHDHRTAESVAGSSGSTGLQDTVH